MATNNKAVVIANSTALGAFTGSSIFWGGGPGVLVINAAQYGASVQLQMQNYNGTWIAMNTVTISTDSIVEYKAPAGQMRIVSTGSSAGLTANFVDIPY